MGSSCHKRTSKDGFLFTPMKIEHSTVTDKSIDSIYFGYVLDASKVRPWTCSDSDPRNSSKRCWVLISKIPDCELLIRCHAGFDVPLFAPHVDVGILHGKFFPQVAGLLVGSSVQHGIPAQILWRKG